MALISAESLERVKQTADIVEVISAHTDLRRQGARMVGLCPFHEERTPSFSVDPQENLYHCFGCGVGGDVIKFVEEKEGLGFAEAVELLADRYGVELEREQEDPRAEARRQHRRRLEQLLERTAAYYANYLWDSKEAGRARAYLAERGLGEEVLRAFGVGYAPSAWDKILIAGQRAGFKVEEMRAVGLAQKGRGGGEYDRFRERIMFPIRDRRGRTLGFGGRAMRPDQGAKYVNTAETDFFHKSKLLYGLDQAWGAMAKSRRAVVVEGYTDVLALHQAGCAEVAGVMGTAITVGQIAQLSAVVDLVVLALDADSAGQGAMLRMQDAARDRSMRLLVADMPPGTDPAELVADPNGAESFRNLVDAAVDLPRFQVMLHLEGLDRGSPSGDRESALTMVEQVLLRTPDGIERNELIRITQNVLGIPIQTIETRLENAALADPESLDESQPFVELRGRVGKTVAPIERQERSLLAMCIARPDDGEAYLSRLEKAHLSGVGQRAANWLRDNLASPTAGLPRDDEELGALISELVSLAHNEPSSREAMELNFLLLEQRRLEDELAAAGERGDYERRAALSRERAALVERIAHAQQVEA